MPSFEFDAHVENLIPGHFITVKKIMARHLMPTNVVINF